MNLKRKRINLNSYYIAIGVCALFIIGVSLMKDDTLWIEKYYAQTIYHVVSYIYIILFSWVPFSIGDVIYGGILGLFIFLITAFLKSIFRRRFYEVKVHLVRIITFISVLYVVFLVNWGLNYYRQPVRERLGLQDSSFTKEEYLKVVENYIHQANALRAKIDWKEKTKLGVRGDLAEIVKQDTLLSGYLCKTQVHVKEPVSSLLASFFMVSGYFNPFTLEAHVNQHIPKASYPFVHVHELGHQLGIGFEDECNFYAFLVLHEDKDLWYRYSAYYSALGYLLRPLYRDKVLWEKYRAMLSSLVLEDMREESDFWRAHQGWLEKVSGTFYDEYLKANNQPEGMERYSLMVKLLVAWEKQRQEARR
ncbi:DUF3810 domain-containing protein [Sphingobacterium thermophilum]|uniref:DUF3810 domain-containing protein n=1 Tax=Sphingobacterium thermophilum TaxID=768534 RepID=A0ABP8QY84_9SPHI